MFLLIFLTNTIQLILSCKAQSDPYLFFWVLLGSILSIYKNEKSVNIWFLQLLFDFCCSFLLCCNLKIYILAHNVANCTKPSKPCLFWWYDSYEAKILSMQH